MLGRPANLRPFVILGAWWRASCHKSEEFILFGKGKKGKSVYIMLIEWRNTLAFRVGWVLYSVWDTQPSRRWKLIDLGDNNFNWFNLTVAPPNSLAETLLVIICGATKYVLHNSTTVLVMLHK
jgi:hypothetical protein